MTEVRVDFVILGFKYSISHALSPVSGPTDNATPCYIKEVEWIEVGFFTMFKTTVRLLLVCMRLKKWSLV